MAKKNTSKNSNSSKSNDISNSTDARIKYLHERLGELTYLVSLRNTKLNAELREFQRKLNQDKQLLDMQEESNKIANELEALKK